MFFRQTYEKSIAYIDSLFIRIGEYFRVEECNAKTKGTECEFLNDRGNSYNVFKVKANV